MVFWYYKDSFRKNHESLFKQCLEDIKNKKHYLFKEKSHSIYISKVCKELTYDTRSDYFYPFYNKYFLNKRVLFNDGYINENGLFHSFENFKDDCLWKCSRTLEYKWVWYKNTLLRLDEYALMRLYNFSSLDLL